MTIRNQPRMTFSNFADLTVADSAVTQETGAHNAPVFASYTSHSSGERKYTPAIVAAAIRHVHPTLRLTLTKTMTCDLIAFAAAGHAKATLSGKQQDTIMERTFVAPKRRYDEEGGLFRDEVIFACYEYEFEDASFLVYVADCRDGENSRFKMNFILSDDEAEEKPEKEAKDQVDELIQAATRWALALHEEVLVFDQGMWQKDKELWKSVQKATWEDVILDEAKKTSLIKDVNGFFNGEANYKEFSVPWKRGLIFHGPPGNGKTISIKALMHSLSQMTDPTVEMLYVKSFKSFQGPEYGIRQIFTKARSIAPCLLIFEDIDSLVTDAVRSYFLNEVDGLESNHGVLMVGSTNHLDRLDPGIAKRPSRFDRKYLFALPTRDERVQYCDYWRNRLKHNDKIDFPPALSGMIADITEDFSFAYIKEAFVASLLAIVVRKEGDALENDDDNGGQDEAEKSILWKEIQKQVKILREELSNADKEFEGKTLTTGLDVGINVKAARVMRAE